eukprot:2742999-Prymnesium_polylepis.1
MTSSAAILPSFVYPQVPALPEVVQEPLVSPPPEKHSVRPEADVLVPTLLAVPKTPKSPELAALQEPEGGGLGRAKPSPTRG